jgi:hypothetical protein
MRSLDIDGGKYKGHAPRPFCSNLKRFQVHCICVGVTFLVVLNITALLLAYRAYSATQQLLLNPDSALGSAFQRVETIRSAWETIPTTYSDGHARPVTSRVALGLETVFDEKYLLLLHSWYSDFVRFINSRFVIHSANDAELMQLRFDVSTHGEFSIVYRNMVRTQRFPLHPYVVDIGAMDGLTGSNSFNFMDRGFKGIMCEPFPRHQEKIISPNMEEFFRANRGWLWKGAISGGKAPEGCNAFTRQLCMFGDASATSSTIGCSIEECQSRTTAHGNAVRTEIVRVLPAKLLVRQSDEELNILPPDFDRTDIPPIFPQHFGVLTVDAEGKDTAIVQEILEAGSRPLYIISEIDPTHQTMEDENSWDRTIAMERQYGYEFLARVGDNLIVVLSEAEQDRLQIVRKATDPPRW